MINTFKILLLPLIFCFLLGGAIASIYTWLDEPSILHLQQAQFLKSDAMNPPNFITYTAQSRTLPDNWLRSMQGFGGSGWYQIHFPQQVQQGHVWGLFIPRANMNVAVFINGNEIGHSGHFYEPVSRNWARPLYYTIPAEMLSQGENTMHIHLKSYADEAGGLSQLLIGAQDVLLPLYQLRYFIQIDLAKVSFFLNILVGLLTLFLWYLRRSDTVYLWFAIICFSSSVFILNHFLLEIPFSRNVWHFSVYVSIGWFAASLLMFTLHFLSRVNPKWQQALLIYMVVSSMVILLLQNIFIALLWHIGSLAMASYACMVLFRSWLDSNESAELVLFIAALSTLALGFHDWYTRLTMQQFSSPVLMHLGPPLMLVAIAWILTIRFIRAMKKIESFNSVLITRINEVTRDLNHEHQQVQVLLQQEAKDDERQRIMQDLHDGLGNHLMAAHSIARIKQLDDGIQQALNDALFWLRTSIDTLAADDGDVSDLLGTFRYRIEPQLKSCGIALHWHMDDISNYTLPAENKLHVIRVVQEAIANVIKHAKASTIHFHTALQHDGSISISVQDNGCGFIKQTTGHGLKNMQERMSILGGSMNIHTLPSGTCVQFMFPTS